MMTFAILVAIAAAVILLQTWEGQRNQSQPVRIKTEDSQQPRRYRR